MQYVNEEKYIILWFYDIYKEVMQGRIQVLRKGGGGPI